MKQILISMLSLYLILSACGKSDEEPSIEGKTCQIASVDGERFKYDDQGRITNLSHDHNLAGVNITYETNTIKILGPNQIPNIKLTLAGGRVTSATEASSSGSITEYTYSYNNDGYLSKIVMLYGGEVHTYTYSYTDGNLTKIEGTKLRSGTLTNHPTINIEYSKELASNVDDVGVPMEKVYVFTTYKMERYFGKQSKNLVSKTTEADRISNYTYTKDVNGNITSIKRHDLNAYVIKYTCK